MRICGQEFSTDIINRVTEVVTASPGISRRHLSRQVCEWLEWRTTKGTLQEGSCRKALASLHRQGVLRLPNCGEEFRFQRTRERPEINISLPDISCSLAELGRIEVTPVTSRYCRDSVVWKELLQRHHYLGCGTLSGAQLRYLIKSSTYGYLGALAFSSGTWALKDRDQHIGWSDAARMANLKYVVTNDRFLLLPTVRVENLASHVLALALKRLPQDWEERYHVRPMLAETFVDPTRFDGTCYKAANWTMVGHTAGRRDGVKKKILLRPLLDDWREQLQREPLVPLKAASSGAADTWAQREFGGLRLYDNRLKERLVTIAQDFYNRPQGNIPEACGTKARTMGAYRFLGNKKVTMDVILTPHTEATIERIKEHQIVLAPQDTTTLNYGTHPATMGLGPINNIANRAMGLILHDTLAFTADGTPLGILDAQCWARDPEDKGKSERRKALPIGEKESMKWLRSFHRVAEIQKLCPETTLVSVGDREADIYELFLEATKDPDGPKLLVRAEKSRNRQVDQEHLWEYMSGQKVAGALKVRLPRRDEKKAREAIVDFRFAEVELTPPKDTKYQPLKIWAVYVTESEPAESPVDWMLLTTAEVKDFADAKQRVEWYSGRWGIEVYHRTLKTGCRIKDRQLGTADRLETCLGIDMVIAWRIYHLTMLGREIPDHPCTVFFEEVEWKALCCYYSQTPEPPEEPPTMAQAVCMVGSIGGHLGRTGDGMPGTECIWRGIQRLDVAVDMYAIFKHVPLPNIRRCYPYNLLPPASGP
jgi:hypothetical protein